MIPGYLHLDIRRGLKADLLNAALASLLPDQSSVQKTIASLGVDGLSYAVTEYAHCSLRGHDIKFFIDDIPVTVGNRSLHANEIFAQSIVNLKDLRFWLQQKPVPVGVSALVQRIFEQLECSAFTEQRLVSGDALWLVCQVVTFCAQINALDPKFITATKICSSEHGNFSERHDALSLTNSTWINHILVGMPVIEVDDASPIDVVALAFIKALAGHVGARGESRILKIGIGLAAGTSLLSPLIAEALWCEPSLPESMTEHGPSAHARTNSLHEIAGVVSASTDMVQLSSSLSLHGALSLHWQLVQRDRNVSCYAVRFLVNDEDKRDAIEAFLIKGAAFDVTVAVIERHELQRRLVSVPIGTGNKATSARFYEYLYLDKTVRVEPLKEDLDLYVNKTDYSVDVARSDLLLAWKKWRGRVVSEDA